MNTPLQARSLRALATNLVFVAPGNERLSVVFTPLALRGRLEGDRGSIVLVGEPPPENSPGRGFVRTRTQDREDRP